MTRTLTEAHSKTRLTVTASYPSVHVRDVVLSTGMERGAVASYDWLEQVSSELVGAA